MHTCMAVARIYRINDEEMDLTDAVADEEAVLGRPLVVPTAVASRRHDPPVVAADLEGGSVSAAAQRAEEGEKKRK